MDTQEILDHMKGFDTKKEILELWLEVFYLRKILEKSIDLIESTRAEYTFTSDFFEECKEHSQNLLKKKFPHMGVTFGEKNGSNS